MGRRTPREIRGLSIAVTGAGNGIGAETAAQLAAAGARLVLGDRDGAAVRAVAERVGNGAVGVDLDVTDEASFLAFLDRAQQDGPLDVLVNNAGVMWVGPFDQETGEIAARQVEVNLLGVIRGTRLAAPRMAARGHGHVVTIASVASKLAPPGEATYAATKHGVHGYLTAVRAELRRSGVDVSMIMPGVVATALADGTRTGPVRRLRPEEIAEAVVDVVRRPRFETVIPGRIRLLFALVAVLPDLPRRLLQRALLPNQVAAVRKHDRRSGYERTQFRS